MFRLLRAFKSVSGGGREKKRVHNIVRLHLIHVIFFTIFLLVYISGTGTKMR